MGACGIELQTKDGEMGAALLLIAIFVIPFVAAVRFGLMFLSQYCLAWAATKVVADLRVDLLKKINEHNVIIDGYHRSSAVLAKHGPDYKIRVLRLLTDLR